MVEFLLIIVVLLLIAILTFLVTLLKEVSLIHSDNRYWGCNIDYDIRRAHPKAFYKEPKVDFKYDDYDKVRLA